MTQTTHGVQTLYEDYLAAWNAEDGARLGGLFAQDGNLVGFDGSTVDGREAIEAHLSGVFADHRTASYVGKVREVRELAPGVALLRAHAGMVPPGGGDINEKVNTVHALVAVSDGEGWRIALFTATPAALHGRPDASEALTAELREVLRSSRHE
jgi:uncharacterized protein (TIGR02246 family)